MAQDSRKPSVFGDLRVIENFESKLLGNKRAIRIYLPSGYATSRSRRYSVLYMHDGQNLFDGMTSYIPNKEWRVDETTTSLADAGLAEPLIVVGIDNAGIKRGDEYLPTSAKLGDSRVGGQAELYTRFVVEELMPYVNKNYRTRTEPDRTGVCGSSFGGVISYYMATTRPKVFGRAGIVSPSLWWDDEWMTRDAKTMGKKLPVRMWVDMGTAEQGGDKQLVSFSAALKSKGWLSGRDLVTYIEQGGQHNEDAWAKRFGMMLMYLFPARSKHA